LRATFAFLAIAMLTRVVAFGNPVVHVDEEFYLLVGSRMWAGEWPYAEIFDRKPFLLFAINALFAQFGKHALIASQIGASLAAVATAMLLRQIALRVMPQRLSLAAGALYIAMLPGFEGIGAQTPLFYTPFMAAAAVLTLRALERIGLPNQWANGAAAMLACGLALQIKYTVIFEGLFFGAALLWSGHRARWSLLRLIGASLGWTLCAAVPTLMVAAGYASVGQFPAFWQANVLANLAVASPLAESMPRLAVNAAILSGVLVCAGLGWFAIARQASTGAGFVRAWALAAGAGFILFGTWYTHYMLPVLAPLSLLAAAAFLQASRVQARLTVVLAMLSLIACWVRAGYLLSEHGNAAQAEVIAEAIRQHLGIDRRLFIYSGDPAFYRLTNSSLPHPFVFPDHYSRSSAHRFMPVAPELALRQAFAMSPEVVLRVDKHYPDSDQESDRWLAAELATDYRLFASLSLGSKRMLLYERR
jgi:hypothetical protein